MTSSTQTAVAPTVGFTNLMVATEWTKLRTLRSTYITALIAALGPVAVAALVCVRYAQLYATLTPGNRTSDVTNLSLTGVYGAQIAVGALGVLAISGEYGTGMIRGTLTAVPQRRLMLASKALVLLIATTVLGEIASFAGFGLGQAILPEESRRLARRSRASPAPWSGPDCTSPRARCWDSGSGR